MVEAVAAVVVGVPLAAVRAVTGLVSMVGTYLSLATIPDAPAAPSLWAMLAFARREIENAFTDTLFNKTPSAAPFQISQDITETVVGTVNAFDPDGDLLVYRVTSGPAHGDVVVHPNGTFVYTPDAAFATEGGTDTFTVEVDDNSELHFHLGDGGDGQISVPVTVAVVPGATASVAVGQAPQGVAVFGDRAYVSNSADDTVSVIDTGTNEVVATIDLGGEITVEDAGGVDDAVEVGGGFPAGVVVSPDGQRVYVANTLGGSVSVIDTVDHTVVATVDIRPSPEINAFPVGLAVSPDGDRVYVADTVGNRVAVIDSDTLAMVTSIDTGVGSFPVAVAVSLDGARVYIANGDSGTVSVIDAASKTVVQTISVGQSPQAMAVSPDGTRLYVGDAELGTVSVIDTATGIQEAMIGVSSRPDDVVVSPDGSHVYVSSAMIDAVTVIDARSNTPIATIGVGDLAGALAISPDGTRLYLPNSTSNTLSALSVSTNAQTPTPRAPEGILTKQFRVYNLSSHTVTVGNPTNDVENFIGPIFGTKIPPGGYVTFHGVMRFSPRPVRKNIKVPFTSTDGAVYTAELEVQNALFVLLGNVGCQASGGDQCSPHWQPGWTRVVLLDKPGTVTDVPADRLEQQGELLNNVCTQVAQSCSFDAKRQIKTLGPKHPVGNAVLNTTSVPQRYSLKITDMRSQTSSVTISASVGAKIAGIVNAEITTTYGHSWTESYTFSQKVDVTVEPHHEATVAAQQPVYRVFGDFTIVAGNTTFILQDVYFDSPNPNGQGVYTISAKPIDSDADRLAV